MAEIPAEQPTWPTTMEEAMKVAVSVKSFPDEEFRKAANEISNPDLEGYEFFLEAMDIKFYRRYREVATQECTYACD